MTADLDNSNGSSNMYLQQYCARLTKENARLAELLEDAKHQLQVHLQELEILSSQSVAHLGVLGFEPLDTPRGFTRAEPGINHVCGFPYRVFVLVRLTCTLLHVLRAGGFTIVFSLAGTDEGRVTARQCWGKG